MKFKCILFSLFEILIFICSGEVEGENIGAFDILKWEVGQYAVYQVISIENASFDNRYKFSIINEEEVGGKKFFWIEMAIFEGGCDTLEKTALFRVLMSPVTTEEFSKNPCMFIKNGFFPYNALKIYAQFEASVMEELSLESIAASQGVIEDNDYVLTPDALGRINCDNLEISSDIEAINTDFGQLNCYRLSVITSFQEDFHDEGITLWRSSQVPFLGIVRMEFSQTNYWEKYYERTKQLNFFEALFYKVVPGRERPDIYRINLIDYGKNS